VSSTDEIRSQVREIVSNMAPAGKRVAQSTDRLVEDLGYDSLAIVELSLQIESVLGLTTLAQEDGADVVTVADIEDLVVDSLAGDAAGPPTR
jgi:acyl carrier protein